MEGLALGVAQDLLADRFAASRNGFILRYCNALQWMPYVVARCLRRLSPLSSIRYALCGMRSRMASARVGLPTTFYQRSIGTWLVMINDPLL